MSNHTRHIVIANQKGGVAKSTTAVNLAWGLAFAGKNTLLIDMDAQANASFAVLGITEPQATVYEFLLEDEPELDQVIHPTDHPGLHIMPSKRDLAAAEELLIPRTDGYIRLRKRLNKYLPSDYDFIIIDSPPSLGRLTANAMAAATEIIIPVNPSMFGLQGISKLEELMVAIQEDFNNPELHISGILCTFYDYSNVSQDVIRIIAENYNGLIFDTIIPKNIKIEEANSRSTNVYTYAPDSKGALAYANFVEEVLNRDN